MERDLRLPALRRFAVAITVLNILGYTVLGFEQAWVHLVAGVLTAYAAEFLFESLSAWSQGRTPRYRAPHQQSPLPARAGDGRAWGEGKGEGRVVDFLLSPHITGCAVSMLLYPGGRVMPIVFGALVAIASKTLFRAPLNGGTRHFLNPSNFGITATLVVFPWVAISPPYHFTEHLWGWVDWLLPAIIITSGTFLNSKFTKRMPLIAGWLLGFIAQAIVRTTLFDQSMLSALLPMTGVAFILFTFYMVTDPATTPDAPRAQFVFGASVAVAYGVLVAGHIVFGLFFALTFVTAARGVLMMLASFARRGAPEAARVPA